jgi:beta-glucanase (GH16 family)
MNKFTENKYLFILISTALAITQVQCKSGAANVPVKETKDEEIIFFDDFSANVLDSTKWNVEVTGMHVNNELQAYVDSSATISFVNGAAAEGAENGALVLQPLFSPGYITKDGQKFDFISGKINTKNKVEVAFGSVSAKIKLTEGPGLWPAWWMLGNGNWPETGETDIMEYIGEKDWVSSAVHGKGYSGDAALVDRLYFPDSSDVTHWHIYRVDWTPESIIFKYDEIPMFRITKPMTQFFGEWAFDNPKYLILNFAAGGVYPFKINGIKEPYYGLPASTLEQIKNGKSKMLVDWVKVTKR